MNIYPITLSFLQIFETLFAYSSYDKMEDAEQKYNVIGI